MDFTDSTEFIEAVAESTFSIIDHVNLIQVFGIGLFDMLLVLFVASVAFSIITRFLFGGGSNDDRH